MAATKEQEKAALEKIRKIVDGVGGHDSYIGKAFEGCFAIAEENIDNDFWNSYHDKCATEHQSSNLYKTQYEKALERVKELETKLEDAEAKYEKDMIGVRAIMDTAVADRKDANAQVQEHWNKRREAEDRAEALELEIMKLKAKLYDLMTAQ